MLSSCHYPYHRRSPNHAAISLSDRCHCCGFVFSRSHSYADEVRRVERERIKTSIKDAPIWDGHGRAEFDDVLAVIDGEEER
jgi:hypothetical protein